MYKMRDKPRWTMATARQHLSELVASSAHEPQRVYRRNLVVAAVVSPSALENVKTRATLAEALAALQQACAEERYELVVPPRVDRPNPMATADARKRRKR